MPDRIKPRRRTRIRAAARFPADVWVRKYSRAMQPHLRRRAAAFVKGLDSGGVLSWFAEYLRVRYHAEKQQAAKKLDPDADSRAFNQRAEKYFAATQFNVDDVMSEFTGKIFQAGSGFAFGKLGFKLTWSLKSPAYERALETRINQIKGIGESQFAELCDMIRNQCYTLGGGPTSREFIQRIQQEAGKRAEYQAERIARTETLGVAGSAAQVTFGENGVERKEWIYSGSGYERHEGLAGEIVPIDEPFSNGLMYPGDPSGDGGEVCNCMCDMAPVVTQDVFDALAADGVVNE